ncbi:MAG: SGNH/GDSL hydrolase family protein [Eubacteriales bacterium]|nr:SGNH/GDSL hydrolase family protein [Eubacteriales bacterium]
MRILFQGDSITDVGRSRENNDGLGAGYPHLLKAALGFEEPKKYEFFNHGISGNRVVDLYARIKADIINLKPDVMSILIGVNDVWHELHESPNGVDADKYFKIYDMLVSEVKAALPDIKIMIMEPFVLKGSATEANWDYFDKEVKLRAEMAKKIADKYNLPFMPLQDGFDKLSEKAEPSYWLQDGVHPTEMGHEYIKNEWLKLFETIR